MCPDDFPLNSKNNFIVGETIQMEHPAHALPFEVQIMFNSGRWGLFCKQTTTNTAEIPT